jgi:hypothetical protein
MEKAFRAAAGTPLEFHGDCLVFPFRTSDGREWMGCLEEWVGNEPLHYAIEPLDLEGRTYVELGSSGGGADKVLLRDDGGVCYFNDFDQSLSKVANTVENFIALLRRPEADD